MSFEFERSIHSIENSRAKRRDVRHWNGVHYTPFFPTSRKPSSLWGKFQAFPLLWNADTKRPEAEGETQAEAGELAGYEAAAVAPVEVEGGAPVEPQPEPEPEPTPEEANAAAEDAAEEVEYDGVTAALWAPFPLCNDIFFEWRLGIA